MRTDARPWFKLYNEWATDPKVQQLSERDQRRMVMIMCFACRGDAPDVDRWAFASRVRPSEMRSTVARLREIGFLDDQLQICNWGKRQGLSDAQRKRQQRDSQKIDYHMSQDSHVTVPGLSQDCPALEERREEKKREEERRGDGEISPSPLVEKRRPNVPYQEILQAYHDELPTLQRVIVYSDDIKAHVARRWREDEARHDIEWWRAYFRSVGGSEFLMGRTEKPFNCTFGWLVKPTNMAKVINGAYANKSRSRESKTDAMLRRRGMLDD